MTLLKTFNKLLLTTLSMLAAACGQEGSSQGIGIGKVGSKARISIRGNFLFAVADHKLNVINIENPAATRFVGEIDVGADAGNAFESLETAFIYGNYLFIGATTGAYIYDIEKNPERPEFLSLFRHSRACDPVVANATNAFVTVNSGVGCPGDTNALHVLDITNIREPKLEKRVSLNGPSGLSLDDKLLYVCDKDELLVFSVQDAKNPEKISTTPVVGCSDIIVAENSIVVTAQRGIEQFAKLKIGETGAQAPLEKLSTLADYSNPVQ